MLAHRRPKVGNYVSSCCAGTNYYTLWTWIYTRTTNVGLYWVETVLLVDRSDSDHAVRSCHSLLSLLCRAMLSCFWLGILLPPFRNHFWNIWVTLPKNIYLISKYHYIFLVAIGSFLSVLVSLSPLLWIWSLGIFLSFLHFHKFVKGTLSISSKIHTQCTCNVLWNNLPCQSLHTPYNSHIRIADHIKNGGPYWCLIRIAWNA